MANKPLLRSSTNPYHVTVRANNREWFSLPLNVLWTYFSEAIFTASIAYGARVHAFVLMSNHIHLLISTPDGNLDDNMNYVLREVSKRANNRTERSGHLFGGRYRWSFIGLPLYYAHAVKYVYRNPLRAGLCANVEEYPYSTIQVIAGMRRSEFPFYNPIPGIGRMVPDEIDELLAWLNRPPRDVRDNSLIKSALRRRSFRFSEYRVKTTNSTLLQAPL
jgi:putative transposase